MRSALRRTVPAGSARQAAVTVALAATLAACTAESGADTNTPKAADSAEAPATSVAPAPAVPQTTATTVPPSTAWDRGELPARQLSFHAYQQEVAAADQTAHASLANLAKTGSFGALQGQAAQSAETVAAAAARLRDLVPPEHLTGQHEALAASLEEFANGLEGAAGKVGGQEVCAAPAMLAELNGLPATGKVRAATHAFGAAGGGRVTFLPNLTPPRPQRPGSGDHLRPKETSGLGELTVDNHGIGRDAVVTLARGNSAVLSVYVRGNSSTTVGGIGDAGYTIFYSHGSEWSPSLRAFARDCDTGRFADAIAFETTSTQYTTWEISLREQLGGNAPTTPVDPDDVPK